jgi:hypothetical protein
VIHVVTPRRRAPVGIVVVLKKLDVELVQARGGSDVERVLADSLSRGDAGKRQEETEVICEVGISAGDRFARIEVLGLQRDPSVARMNLALFAVVFGLARSFASVSPTWPSRQTAI